MMALSIRFIARGLDGKELVREAVELDHSDLDHSDLGKKPLSTPLIMFRKYAPGM